MHRSTPILTDSEVTRLAQIRSKLIQLEAEGMDTADWEATFFLKIINKLAKERK